MYVCNMMSGNFVGIPQSSLSVGEGVKGFAREDCRGAGGGRGLRVCTALSRPALGPTQPAI
jgi:hypothetical protein